MATKRKTYQFRGGEIIEVQEYHDGRYGAPGEKRTKKEKPTEEQMLKVNQHNRMMTCRHKLLQYINQSDFFITLTYRERDRPADMEAAYKDFNKAIRKIREWYKSRGQPLYWFRNIERGTKGAWHVHLVMNAIDGAEGAIRKAWTHGAIYLDEIRLNDKIYDEDYTKLANYLTKNEKTEYKKEDGTAGKPRIKEASYNTSRNMPLPEPKKRKLVRWKKEAKPWNGYRILRIHEGINPVTGYKYRRYTMVRIADNVRRKKEKKKK